MRSVICPIVLVLMAGSGAVHAQQPGSPKAVPIFDGRTFNGWEGDLKIFRIQTIITFQGNLSSWWTRIVIGALLFVFVLLQRTVVRRTP